MPQINYDLFPYINIGYISALMIGAVSGTRAMTKKKARLKRSGDVLKLNPALKTPCLAKSGQRLTRAVNNRVATIVGNNVHGVFAMTAKKCGRKRIIISHLGLYWLLNATMLYHEGQSTLGSINRGILKTN